MKRVLLLGLVGLVCFDTTGQLGFKFTADVVGPVSVEASWLRALTTNPYFYVTLASYLGAFVVYMTMLRHAPVGPLFAASHIELVTVTAFSVAFFGERFNPMQTMGCALIIAGIVLLAITEGLGTGD